MYRGLLTILFALLSFTIAQSGNAQALEGRQRPMSKEEQEFSKKVKLTYADAKKIALEKAPGTIFNWELEKEDEAVIYSIEVQLPDDKKESREVNVDAVTGKVVEVEKEDLQKSLDKAKSAKVAAEDEDRKGEDKENENEEEDDDR